MKMPVLRFTTGQAFYNDTLKKHFDFSKCFLYVGEKIRTPDLLVRSQTLYPAELRPHSLLGCLVPYNDNYYNSVLHECQ